MHLLIIIVTVLMVIIRCKKDATETVTVTDIDGNIYNTVTIGTQVWMKENLKTTKYSNGDIIGTTNPSTLDITSEATPKYQWAYDGNETNVATYGRLYTWFVVSDSRNVCPTGWHLPSDAEWTTLITFLGGDSVAGGKLKEIGTTHWTKPNTGATNETGFTALPGGVRQKFGTFMYTGNTGTWWNSTENSAASAYYTSIGYYYIFVDRYYLDKLYGFSVRCLQNS